MVRDSELLSALACVHHTTVIYWLKQIGEKLPDAPPTEEIPEVGEMDELETFVGSKKTLMIVMDSSKPLSPRNFSLGFRRS